MPREKLVKERAAAPNSGAVESAGEDVSRSRQPLDEIDRRLLELLRRNARRTFSDMAQQVALSVAPVRRRIARLEATGVIAGYTTIVSSGRLGTELEAITELRFVGDMDIDDIVSFASSLPEVEEVLTLAGDPDALVRLRVTSVEHLQQVVNSLRRSRAGVIGTKTQIVLASWRKGQDTSTRRLYGEPQRPRAARRGDR